MVDSALAGKPRVLIVDDELQMVRLYRSVLEEAGYDPSFARTGEEAVQILCEGAAPDVVLLDYELPDMYGPQVLAEVERECPTVLEESKFFGFSFMPPRLWQPSDHVKGHFEKPYSWDGILDVVRKAFARAAKD